MRDRIDEMLDERYTADKEYEKKLNTEIRTGMIRTIYSRVLIVFLAIALISMGGYSAYRSYKDSHAFHLDQFDDLADAEAVSDETARQNANTAFLIQCYYEITQPGYYIYSGGMARSVRESDESFRMYNLGLVHYFRTNKEVPGSSTVIDGIHVRRYREWGTYSASEGNFYLEELPYSWWRSPAEYRHAIEGSVPSPKEELSDLPGSASAELEIMFKEDMSAEEMLSFAKEYPESEILFALTGLPDEENSMMPEGFSLLFGSCNMSLSSEAISKYPMLGMVSNHMMGNARPEYTADDYLTHYKSVLTLLVNNRFGHLYELEEWQKRLDDLEKGEKPRVIGIRIVSSRNDALKLTEDERVQKLHIMDMKMNRFDN